MFKGIATLVFGMVVGAVVVSNSTLVQGKPQAAPAEEVVVGHRVTPMGIPMVAYANARAQVVSF